ncbi:MAG: N-acetyltransferase [Candidatus Lokiarchaeota archaeon]
MGTDKKTQDDFHSLAEDRLEFGLKKCSINDLEGVIEVNEKELPEDYPYFFYKSILDNYQDSFLIAYDINEPDNIMGYIMWRLERTPSVNSLKLVNKGHLVSIAVLTQYRRMGIASALLRESMPEIKKYGISEYVLEVRVSNYPAINLYKKFEYKIKSIKRKYYRDGENAYFMVKKVKTRD